MSMIKDIKTHMVDQGLSVPVSLACLPPKPDDVIALYQYDGQSPLISAGIERPGIQVRSRSPDYEAAMANIKAVADILRRVGHNEDGDDASVDINGTLYHRIIPVQSAFEFGKDENDRHVIVQNFYVNKEW